MRDDFLRHRVKFTVNVTKLFTMNNVHLNKLALFLTLSLTATGVCMATPTSQDQDTNSRSNGSRIPSHPSTVKCPAVFEQITIVDNAKLCQAFNKNSTAVMVYHSSSSPSELLAVYRAAHPSLNLHPAINDRNFLSSNDKSTRIIISPDSNGSQIDILVTSPQK